MFEPTALYQNAATGQYAYGWQLNQYAGSGLGRNIFSTLWHKVKKGASNVAHAATHTTLGKIALGVGVAAAGAKLGQKAGWLPKGSLVDLVKLTPGIVANQATRLGRGVAAFGGAVGHAIFGGSARPPASSFVGPPAPSSTSPSALDQIAKAAGWTVGTAAKVAAPVAAAVVAPMVTGETAPQPRIPVLGAPNVGSITPGRRRSPGIMLPDFTSPTPRIQIPERSSPSVPTAPLPTRRYPAPAPTPRIVPPPAPAAPASTEAQVGAPAPSSAASKALPLLLAAGAALALSS